MANEQLQDNEQDRIYSVMTQRAWLHVDQAFSIGKIRLFAGNYAKGQGAISTGYGFIDADAARVVLNDLMVRGSLPASLYKEQKVEFFGGSVKDGQIEARVITIAEQPQMKSPIMFKIASGPGEKTATGGFKPAGKLDGPAVFLSAFEARKLAGAVLEQMAAWQTAQIMGRAPQPAQRPREQGLPAETVQAIEQGLKLAYPADEVDAMRAKTLERLCISEVGNATPGQAKTWIEFLSAKASQPEMAVA